MHPHARVVQRLAQERASRGAVIATERELALDKSDPYFWKAVVPELKLWSVLVVDLAKTPEAK